jgi:Uri superfamily endonuclease
MSIVWVLLFLQAGDARQHEVHVYATQEQCEEALGDVLSRGFARVEELGCERREQKQGLLLQ